MVAVELSNNTSARNMYCVALLPVDMERGEALGVALKSCASGHDAGDNAITSPSRLLSSGLEGLERPGNVAACMQTAA